jgi:hypothetical protein
MRNIETIYNEILKESDLSADVITNIYNKNIIYFNNVKNFKDKDELILFIEIINELIKANYKEDRYNFIIEVTERYLKIIDSECKCPLYPTVLI